MCFPFTRRCCKELGRRKKSRGAACRALIGRRKAAVSSELGGIQVKILRYDLRRTVTVSCYLDPGFTATVLTLGFVPTLYSILFRVKFKDFKMKAS